jgi:predicted Zn-dependent peptidase
MNKLDSLNKNTKIYTPEEVVSFIKNISKKDFVKFINHVLNFDNLKIVYQAPKK